MMIACVCEQRCVDLLFTIPRPAWPLRMIFLIEQKSLKPDKIMSRSCCHGWLGMGEKHVKACTRLDSSIVQWSVCCLSFVCSCFLFVCMSCFVFSWPVGLPRSVRLSLERRSRPGPYCFCRFFLQSPGTACYVQRVPALKGPLCRCFLRWIRRRARAANNTKYT